MRPRADFDRLSLGGCGVCGQFQTPLVLSLSKHLRYVAFKP